MNRFARAHHARAQRTPDPVGQFSQRIDGPHGEIRGTSFCQRAVAIRLTERTRRMLRHALLDLPMVRAR
jgi:hypothetical protein